MRAQSLRSESRPGRVFNATGECLKEYFELTCWTLVRQDPRFIHQHAVDAYAAQHAGWQMHPITAVFALIGLYLTVEKGYTGRQVQLAHMMIGKRDWPRLEPPEYPGKLTVMDVLDTEREEMLMQWTSSVWQSWEHRHVWVREMTKRVLYGKGR